MDQVFQITDLVLKILAFIPDGATYKAATLVCQQWHTICAGELRWMIAAYSNHLRTLLFKFPTNTGWNWDYIAGNPNLPIDIIMNNSEVSWRWIDTIINPNMTWEIIQNNLHKFSDYQKDNIDNKDPDEDHNATSERHNAMSKQHNATSEHHNT